jgi:hypothetical protein
MLITIIFVIISLILVLFLTLSHIIIPNNQVVYPIRKLIFSSIVYLLVVYLLADFYNFNPLEIDDLLGIMVNPYVAVVSIILQFLNIVLLVDTWYKALIGRVNKKFSLLLLTIIFDLLIIIGNFFLYYGYNGTSELAIYTNIKFINRLSIIILYIPYVLYDLNILNIIFSIKKGRNSR